jgi:carboxyl-terminal processing protease
MKHSVRIIACFLLLFSPVLCLGGKKPTPQPQNSPTALTPDAAAFLTSALDLMQEHTLNGQAIDWATVRAGAFKRAAGAFNPIDTYPAIYWALVQLNDPGSRLRLPPGLYPDQIALLEQAEKDARASAPASAQPVQPPTPFAARHLPEGHIDVVQGKNFGHVILPGCSAKDSDGLLLYAADVRRILTDLSNQKPQGWIVDLRGNTGGNMWPMLAGIGPILGEGVVGSFVVSDGKIPWFYQDGKSGTRNMAGLETVSLNLQDTPLRVTAPGPVAVLIDRSTASSAEAVTVAFHGREDTRFFGQHTAGKSNAVQPFKLPDGAELYLTTAIDADRTGKTFPAGLAPDEAIPAVDAMPQEANDAVVNAAETWLVANTGAPPVAAAAAPPVPASKPKPKRKKVIVHQGS